MYFIGYLTRSYKIDPISLFQYFAIANRRYISEEKLATYMNKKYLWQAVVQHTDKKGNPYFICNPIREVSDDEVVELDKIGYGVLVDNLFILKWNSLGLSQVCNVKEYVESGFDETVLKFKKASFSQLETNYNLWRQMFAKGLWDVRVLQNLLNICPKIDWDTLKLLPPWYMPATLTPTYYSDRMELSEGLYQFSTYPSGNIVNLTKQEILHHSNVFYPPVVITPTDDGLIFSLKLRDIQDDYKLICSSTCGTSVIRVGIRQEFTLSNDWMIRNIELFPQFQAVSNMVIPNGNYDYTVQTFSGNMYKPSDSIYIEFPKLEFSALVPVSFLFSKIQGKCLNADIWKSGDTPENLRVSFKLKSGKTSLF